MIAREPRHMILRKPDPPYSMRNRTADLRKIKDKGSAAGPDFPIVKVSGLIQQGRQSSFRVEPFHQGSGVRDRGVVRRKITEDAGRGLEKLGHALEYLTDEFVYDGCRVTEDYGRLQAIQLLASLNRQIYFACGVEPTFRERVQALFRRLVSQANMQN
jgi:hypothetical protein